MDLKWLEDFISLAETHSFSARPSCAMSPSRRSPAASARWKLAGRGLDRPHCLPHPADPAGRLFHGQALEIIAQLNHARALLRGQQSAPPDTLNIAVPHNLALTFFPKWLTEVKRGCGEFSTRLTAGNVHDAVMALESGSCDVLLCYHHPHQPVLLDPARYDMLALGEETLRPYARRTASGQPAFSLPGSPQQPIPFLAYAAGAYLERMVALMVANGEEILHLTPCYRNRYGRRPEKAWCWKATAWRSCLTAQCAAKWSAPAGGGRRCPLATEYGNPPVPRTPQQQAAGEYAVAAPAESTVRRRRP